MKNNQPSQPVVKIFLIGALIGAAAGALTTLLYLPQTGEKLRQQLKDKSKKIKKGIEDCLKQTQEIAQVLKSDWEDLTQSNPDELEIDTSGWAADKTETKGEKTSEPGKADLPASEKVTSPSKKKPNFFRGI